jgi:hypothetical protein
LYTKKLGMIYLNKISSFLLCGASPVMGKKRPATFNVGGIT